MARMSVQTLLPRLLAAFLLTATCTLAQDAVWRAWSEFSPCTVPCGGGVQDRHRTCNVLEDGAQCDGPADDFQFCNFDKCPIDGVWSEWDPWNICSVSCGGGIHTRNRRCIGLDAGGLDCVGDPMETEPCSVVPCPVDGAWSTWTAYSPCSTTCGGGVQARTRLCNTPAPAHGGVACFGEDTDHDSCNLQDCPQNLLVDGNWGPWALMSPCSTSCEAGTQYRTRSCSNPLPANGGSLCDGSTIQELSCNLGECPIDGDWGEWSSFSTCSVSCGGGIKQKFRLCEDPAPQYGGALCSTTPLPLNVNDVTGEEGMKQAYTEACNPDLCQPINGSWSEWSGLYRCSVTCGEGVQRRMRTCDNPLAQNGGLPCDPTEPANTTLDGVVIEFKTFPCVTGVPCPVHGEWNTWTSWSTCDVTCGTGSQMRTRTCTAPAHGGVWCEGDNSETQECPMPVCNIAGGWTNWASWTDCSATCGNGTRTHTRTCTNPPPSGNGANCTGDMEASEACNTQACPSLPGGWSLWSTWTSCSEPCDHNGIRTRLRRCDNPVPERGGADCEGDNLKFKLCDDELPCINAHQDGGWGLWGSFTVCSAQCGTGERVRTRACDTPYPSPWGMPCIREPNKGPLYYPPEYLSVESERKLCNSQPCEVDGQWGSWSPWSSCTKTCGGGLRWRRQQCSNPSPQHGGLHCPNVSPYINYLSEAEACNSEVCSLDVDLTTTPPLSTTTLAKKFCDKVPAYDGLEWPRIEVGTTVQIPCPAPSVGPTFRRCESENRWGNIDTTRCLTADLEELDQMATDASKHTENVTALRSAVNLAHSMCTAENIKVSGELKTCLRVIIKLAERGIPMEPLLSETEKKQLYGLVLICVNEILSVRLKALWDSITTSEYHDDINTLSELPNSILEMAKDMALYRQKTKGKSFIQVRENVEAAVDVVSCDTTTNYRYPYKPPAPTEPSKHVRGGWTAPAEPHLTYASIRRTAFLDTNCIYNRRKRQSGSMLAGLLNVTQRAEKPTKYPVTLVFHSLHDLLPDINKMPYTAPPNEPGSEYIPVEDIHIVNSKVVSVALVGKTEGLNASMTIMIRFYYNKEGRDHICATLDMQKRNLEYDHTLCNKTKTTVNYTDCECSLDAGTFVLLMRPGVIRDNVTYEVTPDVFLEYGCYIGVFVHAVAILLLLLIGLWDVDRHWVVINFCLSTILYQLFTVVGQRWVNEDSVCYFMSWLVHYATIVNISWVMGLTALLFKQAHNIRPLRFRHRIYYVLICWLIPCFIAIIPAALRHGYVIRKYFCWLSPEEHTHLAFFIPVVVIAVVALIILAVTFHINRKPSKLDLEELLERNRATSKRFQKALFGFIFIVLFTLLMLGLNIGIGFLLGNICQCMFVALIFVILNEDVQDGYGNKKQSIEEYIRLKKEQQQDGPDLQSGGHEGDPEWVQQTRTAPMVTVDLSNNYNRRGRLAPIHESVHMEDTREARRERRRQKKLQADKPVYVARSEGQGPAYSNPRAAAYRPAPTPVRTPAPRPESVPLSQPMSQSAIRRSRRTKSRAMTKNMTSQ